MICPQMTPMFADDGQVIRWQALLPNSAVVCVIYGQLDSGIAPRCVLLYVFLSS